MIKETIELLGLETKDKVTGFAGVITSVCFDLYGCVQVAITPKVKEGDQEVKFGNWFDINRVEISTVRVMEVPAFDQYGSKPLEYNKGAAPKLPPRQ